MRPGSRGGVCHQGSVHQGCASHGRLGLGATRMSSPQAGVGPWALTSLILLRVCLVLNADAWRMEGQSSPGSGELGFWGG